MLPVQRRAATHRLIEEGVSSIEALASTLNVSLSTVRRDLDQLERLGAVRRVHGGAVLVRSAHADDAPEAPLGPRAVEHADEKSRIGERAAALIEPGTSLLITGGTSTAAVIPHLVGIPGLTVVTNSLDLASRIASTTDIDLVLLGGGLRRPELSLLGPLVGAGLEELHIDHTIMGVYGIDPRSGLLGADSLECETDRRLAHSAARLTVLADSSKFEKRSAHRIGALQIVSEIVTTDLASQSARDAMRQAGVTVLVA